MAHLAHPRDCDRRWFKWFGRRDAPADIRLLCFHHAGGSAAIYRQWSRMLPPSIEPVAVQLPGRADRFNEPAFDRMGPLVDELVEVLKPLLDRPFACYGVSMGSRVAWALTHALRARSMPMPNQLFLACDIAPSHHDGTWPWEGRTDGLMGYLREMGGTPPEVLAEPDLVSALLPTLRADLTVLSTHGFHQETPLDVRIRAFAGTDDPSAPPDRLTAWQAETTARFDLDVLQSGHFFNADAERQVIETIGHDLARDR
jgi:medium-chain acyl-[acyl-carrier-protein] hydrolase